MKSQSQVCSATGRQCNLLEVDPSGKKSVHWGCVLEGDIGTPDLLYHVLPAVMFCPATGPM